MTSTESDKAVRYITTLDHVRCQGQWLQVSELARKVEKHAPHRKSMFVPAPIQIYGLLLNSDSLGSRG
jgi:cargo-transport protein YPP1